MIHVKKIEKEHFIKIEKGLKTHEVRFNDCDYRAGDFLALNEIAPEVTTTRHYPDNSKLQFTIETRRKEDYTGRSMLLLITHVLDDPKYCKEGYVIISFMPCQIRIENEWGKNPLKIFAGVPVQDKAEILKILEKEER